MVGRSFRTALYPWGGRRGGERLPPESGSSRPSPAENTYVAAGTEATVTGGGLTRFSLVGFAVALVTVGLGTAVGLAVVPVVGSYLGMLAGGFVAGLALERRPMLESGLAAVLANLGIVAAGSAIGSGVGAAVSALGAVGPAALVSSVLLGFAVGAFGAHFGDDLREGLTEPVEPRSGSTTAHTAVGPPTGEESASTGTERDIEAVADDEQTEVERLRRERGGSGELELEEE